MNHSLIWREVNGPGRMPLWASMVASTTPAGLRKVAIGMPLLAWVRKDCQSDAADSRANTPCGGAELSLLPIQAPTTRAGASGSLGGAR